MKLTNNLFGTYTPLDSPLHRLTLKYKGAFILLLALLLAMTQHWGVGLGALALVLTLGFCARIPLSHWWQAVRSLWLLLAILTVYYLFSGKVDTGADVLLTLLTMIFASKVLLWSTPMPVIIDGFIWLCAPLRWVGGNPETVGLALALMVRSIPVIMDQWNALTVAVAARGVRINSFRLFTPLVIATVAYAQETGDALAARGLDRPGH
ncbi:energy-coupling factor transporter transmembrane component T family protein [Rothia endophytica]|uniref:energy-coupling factor transporter transmembrane component T family protein n=1 Tax=Rothia endophytica TaxID=1324766 RepID=UPI001F370F94|nr:energy-coupling factor transporter transmembrane protein EcfT [Rothia endophytica]